MHRQARYDAVLVTIPALFLVGGAATALTSGPAAVLTAIGTGLAGVSAVGRALFVSPPTDDDRNQDQDRNQDRTRDAD